MKTWMFVCMVVAVRALDNVPAKEWRAFKVENNKTYNGVQDERLRMKVFADNRQLIARHNQRFQQGLESYDLKTNVLADMPHLDYISTMNGFNPDLDDTKSEDVQESEPSVGAEAVPESMDWRTKGAVTGVKAQGRCGSCWSFSATGALEGAHFIKTGRLMSLSEQNLVDCSSAYGNNGCGGGYVNGAFNYVKDNGGIDTEDSYPYRARKGNCSYNSKNIGATDKGYVKLRRGDENVLKQAVGTVGPVAVAVDASHPGFRFYRSGVYYDTGCTTNTHHAVLVVGYDTDAQGGDYWLVKNSWGRRWGDGGYIKMARNRNNHCGIASHASYPLV